MNKNKRSNGKSQVIIFSIISAGIFSVFLGVYFTTNNITLLRPRWNVPVLRMSNETFLIEAETNAPLLDASDFSANITSKLGEFELIINSIQKNWNEIKVEVGLPNSVVNDTLYDLKISAGGLDDEQKHAVKVVSEYKDKFRIILWADTQFGYSPEYEDTWELTFNNLPAMVNQANLINPEFIVLLGDITEVALRSEYQYVYDQCMNLKVPIFAGTGNHDYFSTDEYKRWCEYYNFTFDYGPDFHFTYIDTGLNLDALRDHYFDWLASDLEAHSDVPVKIVGGHAPPYQFKEDEMTKMNRNFEKYNQEFLDLCNEYDVEAYVFGHNHQDQIVYEDGTPFDPASPANETYYIQTNDGKEDGGYRVIQFENKQMVNITKLLNATNGTRDPIEGLTSLDREDEITPNLEVSLNVTGPSTSVNCTIINRFAEEFFENVTVQLDIVGTSASINSNSTDYFISRIEQRVDVANTIMVEVKFYLPNNDSIFIEAWAV